jgi:hypothetical protein
VTPLERVAALAPPASARRHRPVDWASAEADLQVSLPADLRALIDTYGAGSFGDFIWLLEPRHQNGHLDLLRQRRLQLENLRVLRAAGETVPFDIESPAALVPWSVTDNGDVIYLQPLPGTAPESWPCLVQEARGPRWVTIDGSATGFLSSALSGDTRVPVFPDDFPPAPLRFRPA